MIGPSRGVCGYARAPESFKNVKVLGLGYNYSRKIKLGVQGQDMKWCDDTMTKQHFKKNLSWDEMTFHKMIFPWDEMTCPKIRTEENVISKIRTERKCYFPKSGQE